MWLFDESFNDGSINDGTNTNILAMNTESITVICFFRVEIFLSGAKCQNFSSKILLDEKLDNKKIDNGAKHASEHTEDGQQLRSPTLLRYSNNMLLL